MLREQTRSVKGRSHIDSLSHQADDSTFCPTAKISAKSGYSSENKANSNKQQDYSSLPSEIRQGALLNKFSEVPNPRKIKESLATNNSRRATPIKSRDRSPLIRKNLRSSGGTDKPRVAAIERISPDRTQFYSKLKDVLESDT